MNKLKDELLAASLASWQKKGIFFTIVVLSFFPFFITYMSVTPDLGEALWELRYFIVIAAAQGLAQISLFRYLLNTAVPDYVLCSAMVMVLFFQTTYGISVVLVSNV